MEQFYLYFEMAQAKIKIKLWTVEYAKGYMSCVINEVMNLKDDEYDEYSKLIDELNL
jgi:hypothetical protein